MLQDKDNNNKQMRKKQTKTKHTNNKNGTRKIVYKNVSSKDEYDKVYHMLNVYVQFYLFFRNPYPHVLG